MAPSVLIVAFLIFGEVSATLSYRGATSTLELDIGVEPTTY